MNEDIIPTTNGYEKYDTGIEQENEEEYQMDDPFNPEEISIESKVVPMETFLRRLEQGTILLNPDFQRNEVWTPEKKSQLIESLMLKIPLPMFYVSADEKNNYTVVDGLQRLSTIRSFVLGDKYLKLKQESEKNSLKTNFEDKKGEGFILQDLEFWKIYNGNNFNDLPNNIRNRILESEFRFTVINPGTPEEVRRNIFKRLNTGGMALSSQEIRNALYLGNSTRLLKDLSELEEFSETTSHSIKSLRMEDKELILRFISFLIRDYKTYKKSMSIDNYLSDTMIILNSFPSLNSRDLIKAQKNKNFEISEITVIDFDEIKVKFIDAMNRTYDIFGNHSFRKSYGDNRRTAINKALFETWGVLMANLTNEEFANLEKNKNEFLSDYIPIITSPNFQHAISRDSMKTTSVKIRFEQFTELLKTHIV
jgi:uncharacterized protein with ParB-like and HNH nuclease domain